MGYSSTSVYITLGIRETPIQSLLKGSEADKYVFQNLTWSGVYLRSILSNTLLQKLLTLVTLTVTGPEVYVVTISTVLSDSYDSFVNTLNHTKSLEIRDHPGEGVEDFVIQYW